MQPYTKNCRRLHVSHGLGDCLRKLLLDFKVPSYHKNTGGTVYTSFEFRNPVRHTEWELNNASVICDFIKNVSGIRFLPWEEYVNSSIPLLRSSETAHLELAPFCLDGAPLPKLVNENKKNIAIQTRGGGYDNSPKQFLHSVIVDIIHGLDSNIYDAHIVDTPRGNYLNELKSKLHKHTNVYFYEHSFFQNYVLVSLCDVLIAPDSWSKYVINNSGQDLNKIIVCTHLDYVKNKEELLRVYFKSLVNSRTRILGYDDNGVAMSSVADLETHVMLSELSKMLASI
jgi:hypothetical protein